jgi:WD40 repeat protein
MEKAAQLRDTRKSDALDILYDLEKIPLDMRDLARNVAVHSCTGMKSVPLTVPSPQAAKEFARDAVFSRTGDVLAVAVAERILLWDMRTGELRKTLIGQPNWVKSLAVGPDDTLFALNDRAAEVRLWNLNTGEALGAMDLGGLEVHSFAVSPDGLTLAACQMPPAEDEKQLGAAITIWDLRTRKLQFTLKSLEARGGAQVMAFHPTNGTLVAAGAGVQVWDLADRKLVRNILHPTVAAKKGLPKERPNLVAERVDPFSSLALSPDGKTAATINVYETTQAQLFVWDLATGEAVFTTASRPDLPFRSGLAYTPDGQTLVTGGLDTVCLFDAYAYQLRTSFRFSPTHRYKNVPLAISPDGQLLATAPGETYLASPPVEVKLWDVSRPQAVLRRAHRFMKPEFSPDGKSFRLVGPSGDVRTLDLATGRVRFSYDRFRDRNKFAVMIGKVEREDEVECPDERYLVTLKGLNFGFAELKTLQKDPGIKTVVTIQDTQTNTSREVVLGEGGLRSLGFIDGGKTLVLSYISTEGGIARLRDFLDGKARLPHSVKLLDLADGKITASYTVEGEVGAFALTPDRKVMAAANSDGQAVLLDFTLGTVSPPLKVSRPERQERENVIRACSFTKDGTRLVFALGYARQRNTMWDWRAGKEVDEPIPPDAFPDPKTSPDGRFEFRQVSSAVEILDRAIRPPAIFSRGQR